MATPEQMSANSTGWSLKKLPTISLRTPSQSPRRVTSARRIFYHMALPGAPSARFKRPLRRLRLAGRATAATRIRAIFLRSARAFARLCERELEVRGHLLEVPHELIADGTVEHGQECTKRFDSEAGLIEVPVLLGEPAVPERRNRVERLDEEVRDLEGLQLLFELLHEVVVGGRPVLGHEGSQSSKRFPSRSLAQANRPTTTS